MVLGLVRIMDLGLELESLVGWYICGDWKVLMDRFIKVLGSYDVVMVVEGFGYILEELCEGNYYEVVEDLVRVVLDIECFWRYFFWKLELMKVSLSGLIMKWDRVEFMVYSMVLKILDKLLVMI